MAVWLLAVAITAITCLALYYASAGARVNSPAGASIDSTGHFRLVLAGIEADLSQGKLGPAEAEAARAELAREMVRARNETSEGTGALGRGPVLAGLALIAAGAFGFYGLLGSPDAPARPLAERSEAVAAASMTLEEAASRIEARLAEAPDDLEGWRALATIQMQTGRYGEAEGSLRRVLALEGASARAETDLAEALIMANEGAAGEEAMALLASALARDPVHQRAHYYYANELTRRADYPAAAEAWRTLLALSQGNEGWLPIARQGLAFAEAGGVAPAATQTDEAIRGMVESLATRLAAEGGSVEDWIRLVRSHLVLGDAPAAQSAYDAAVRQWPQAFDRGELDTIALGAGLTLQGGEQ